MIQQPPPTPPTPISPKVAASTASGALAVVLVWLIELAVELPGHVELAVTVLVVAAATFLGGYLRPDPLRYVPQHRR